MSVQNEAELRGYQGWRNAVGRKHGGLGLRMGLWPGPQASITTARDATAVPSVRGGKGSGMGVDRTFQ